jgi:hypothetical protein
MADNAKSTTVAIAEDIADAVVAVLGKLESVVPPDSQHMILRTAESIALSAYQAAHPNLWARRPVLRQERRQFGYSTWFVFR